MLYVSPLLEVNRAGFNSQDPSPLREKAALEELEHYFAYVLLQEMRNTVPEETLIGGGRQRETFEEMLDDALSGEIARSGQLGIAKVIARQLETARKAADFAPEAKEPTYIPLATDSTIPIGLPNAPRAEYLKLRSGEDQSLIPLQRKGQFMDLHR